MTDLFTTPSADAAARALLHFLWQGTLLAAAAGLTLSSMTRLGPQVRYITGCAFLAAMALAPVVTFLVLLPDARPMPDLESIFGELPAGVIASAPEAGGRASSWLGAVLFAWASGAGVLTLRAAGGWCLAVWQLSQQRSTVRIELLSQVELLRVQMSIRRGVRVFESARTAVPLVFGAVRPILLVPAAGFSGLSVAQIEAVLAHELAHIARHDFLVNCVQSLVEALLFYHPAVWWLSRRIRQEREMCCDAVAVEICGDRVMYSKALLALEQGRQAFALGATGGNLAARIARLLDRPLQRRSGTSAVNVVMLGLVLATGSLAVWAQRPDPPPLPPPPPRAEPVAPAAPQPAPPTLPDVAVQRRDAPPPPPPPPPEPVERSAYDNWWEQDVAYIRSYQERKRWSELKTEAERQEFIEDFWRRRDPDQSTPRNEAKEEHYRRIAFANERFWDTRPGWRTPRGRIYIIHGPPAEIESHLSEPREIWRYSDGREFEFTGEGYKMTRVRIDGADYQRVKP